MTDIVDISKRRQFIPLIWPMIARTNEVNLMAKEIFNDQRYSIRYSAGKAIARYELLNEQGNWRKDYSEMVFDTKAQANKFLAEKNQHHAEIIYESIEIEEQADE
mgnify:CR=1 FL=1